MIIKNQVVHIKQEWQDEGDSNYTWTALNDATEPTQQVKLLITGGAFPSITSVEARMLCEF